MSSNELEEKDIDFSRGDDGIVFIKTDFDSTEVAKKDNPRKAVMDKLEERGLEAENVQVIALFQSEVSIELQEDASLVLDGKDLLGGVNEQ